MNVAIPTNAPNPRVTKNRKNSIINMNGIMKNKLAMKKRAKIVSSIIKVKVYYLSVVIKLKIP